jgi:nitrate/nitrite-specific signal transduction histidine kinase
MAKNNQERPVRRRRWVVKPRYQVYFAAMLVFLQIDVGLVYQAITQYRIHVLAEEAGSLQRFLDVDLWIACLPTVLLIALGMGVVVYFLGLRFSNQIVGPIPRLNQALRAMANGDFSQQLEFRADDALFDVAQEINNLAGALQQRYGTAGLAPEGRATAGRHASAEPALSN